MRKYSEDLRLKVKKYLANGGSQKETIKIFSISRTTLYRWEKSDYKMPKPAIRKAYKLDVQALEARISNGNDIILRELAHEFGVQISTVWYALKRLGFSKKKSLATKRDVYVKERNFSKNSQD